MNAARFFDIIVLGAGPAGLAAARSAAAAGAKVLVVEREERAGGILKQCIHDGFGLVRYKQKLSGPEYAWRELQAFQAASIELMTNTFVSAAGRGEAGFELDCVNADGVHRLRARALILATGCRERTDRQIFIQGDRPAGIFTAGLAQALVNLDGLLPGRKAVILGSGDIGLIMARRLYLEGVELAGVFEVKHEVSGLERNVQQCVRDFGIPLELGTTVTRVQGRDRVECLELSRVGADGLPLAGSEFRIVCDTLVLSVGLIPENEIALGLGVPLDPATRGPYVDQCMHTLVDGIFACGNAVHVNDLVDYVSESAETAGLAAARYVRQLTHATGGSGRRSLQAVQTSGPFLYCVPQYVDTASRQDTIAYFRANRVITGGTALSVMSGQSGVLLRKEFAALRPPEMERVVLAADRLRDASSPLQLTLALC